MLGKEKAVWIESYPLHFLLHRICSGNTGKEGQQMDKYRNLSNLLSPRIIVRMDEGLTKTALSIDGKRVAFSTADLFEIEKYHEEKSNSLNPQKWVTIESVASFSVFFELEEFTDEEIVALVAERLEIMATRSRNRLLRKAEIPGYYYVI